MSVTPSATITIPQHVPILAMPRCRSATSVRRAVPVPPRRINAACLNFTAAGVLRGQRARSPLLQCARPAVRSPGSARNGRVRLLQLGQLGERRRDPRLLAAEVDDYRDVFLDADYPAEAIAVVCHLVTCVVVLD